MRTVQFLADVNRRVAQTIGYTVRMEAGVHSPDETLSRGIGSCRDSGWLLVAALRELGFAARFVSGYLVQLKADDPAKGGPAEDFTDLHAWAEVYLPGAGWVGLDATSGLFAGEGHIPLSATPNPADSAPVTGLVDPCVTTMEFHNTVRRFREDPRTTLPYTDDQWHEVLALGDQVDSLLDKADVRLTIGGEPTFVSATDGESAQWNIAADGEDKRRMATVLAAELKQHYAPQRRPAPRPGQVVSRRAAAALADRDHLAGGRPAAVARRRAARRSVGRCRQSPATPDQAAVAGLRDRRPAGDRRRLRAARLRGPAGPAGR